ncbi:MAG: hypothetical protein HY744_31990 [Deltaproteobacteria bacterium]|nr:hypothetical protein [Deltaproteobacteria bacterium]
MKLKLAPALSALAIATATSAALAAEWRIERPMPRFEGQAADVARLASMARNAEP